MIPTDKMSLTRKVVKWVLWKPLHVLFRYIVMPLSVKTNDKLIDIHQFIVRKSMEGEMPF